MLPENRIPSHPGEILQEQFLEPLGLTQVRSQSIWEFRSSGSTRSFAASAVSPRSPPGFWLRLSRRLRNSGSVSRGTMIWQ
jgi:hypothetical protein